MGIMVAIYVYVTVLIHQLALNGKLSACIL